MFLNTLNSLSQKKSFWIIITSAVMLIFLSPLFGPHLYVPTYDNLDSNVIWYKILAESGKIFASNHAVIPNMMNGIPRLSYSSEFDLLLWLYYFFGVHDAYIINEVLIHLIALIGSYLFLDSYVVSKGYKYRNAVIFTTSIYFATVAFWSGAGATIATLPLTTFILLEAKNNRFKPLYLLIAIFIVSYSSLVFMYLFYFGFAVLYWIYVSVKDRHLHKTLGLTILLFTLLFIFKEYRLFLAMFFDQGFVSHRSEFDVFFKYSLYDVYRYHIIQDFLIGYYPHLHMLQRIYIIPLMGLSLLLLLKKDRFSKQDSIILWFLIIIAFSMPDMFKINIVDPLFTSDYSLPFLILLSCIVYMKIDRFRQLPLLVISMIILLSVSAIFHYQGFEWITTYIPLLKSFNMTRLSFVLPILLIIALALTIQVFLEKLHYTLPFLLLFLAAQVSLALGESFYQNYDKSGYLTFDEYYDPPLFQKIKEKVLETENKKPFSAMRFVSYGLEPAVSLYNGFYTVDGYATNYPLAYKKRFRSTQAKELLDVNLTLLNGNRKLYDKWGSKLYLLGMSSVPESSRYYAHGEHAVPAVTLLANEKALCNLHTDYLLSTHPLKDAKIKSLKLVEKFRGKFWNIWLYRLLCIQKKVR